MRIISLNVEGIAQAASRGLFEWLSKQEADIICLQNLQDTEDRLQDDIYYPEGYHAYFYDRYDGRHGVAIYTRHVPRAIMMGFGYNPQVELDGLYIRADYEQFSVVSLLVPPATADEATQFQRQHTLTHLRGHMEKISHKRRKYIFCNSWYMALRRIDVENAENHQRDFGFTGYERHWQQSLMQEVGYVDAFRQVSDEAVYNWWPSGTLYEGDGWRGDTQLISSELADYVVQAQYVKAPFSTHLPLVVDYDIDP